MGAEGAEEKKGRAAVLGSDSDDGAAVVVAADDDDVDVSSDEEDDVNAAAKEPAEWILVLPALLAALSRVRLAIKRTILPVMSLPSST